MTPDESREWDRWAIDQSKSLLAKTEQAVSELERAYKVLHGPDATLAADDHPRYLELLTSMQAMRRDVAESEAKYARGESLRPDCNPSDES